MIFSSYVSLAVETKPAPKVNKLLYMYRFFYLPFSLDFKEGQNPKDVLPFVSERAGLRLLSAQEMIQLDGQWRDIRKTMRPKSLLLTTPITVDSETTITNHMMSHRLSLTRSAFDQVPISERVVIANAIQGKSDEVKNRFRQLQFLKSFIKGTDPNAFHFFIVSPSWCQSSREYTMLFENFIKKYPQKNLVIHSVVIEDPQEKIFDSRVLAELFPNKTTYTHDNVPRFLSLEIQSKHANVWEEGQALEQLYSRFFGKYRGFLDDKTSLFGKKTLASEFLRTQASRAPASLAPTKVR